ncbi:expressed unknown protein [Ectocarpus siliculosus]|uniref:Transmembrane protein n=1 Tax=Ectocarpus siliculosus TaxID=2880 RepID=D7G5V5_ECTSI|nr:expressed unknown protein [Ectocarpus siliculosus]|eukprot:CBJ27393.1 expressed unknown protein [Ectocarpus siliculosus]
MGVVLATCLLLGAPTFVGSANLQAHETVNGDAVQKTSSLLNASTVQQSTTKRLRQKLLEVETVVAFLRHDVLHTLPEPDAPQVQDLLVTVEMFTVKLDRLLSRAPYPDTAPGMKKVVMRSELLCPVIDQLASALAGLSGAASGEQATVVLQIKSSLVNARALDPSAYLPNLPMRYAANGVKVVLSFAQVVAATPLVLVVRRSNTLRSFLGGLDMVNFTVPKVFSATCLVHGTFYGELVFKTIAPLGVAIVIMGVRTFLRSSCITDGRTWRGRSMKCNECLLALTYFVQTPAINAALRTLSYEPRAWWYEIFETCRRILLTSLVFFATRTSMQLWIAMGFTVLSLVMNVVFSPFVEIIHDSLYSSAQISDGIQLDCVPRGDPLGVSVDETNEEHRPRLPPLEPTPVHRVGTSVEFETLLCSPLGSRNEEIRSKTTENATHKSTSSPTSLSQAQSRRTQMECCARRKQDHSAPATVADAHLRAKKSARARSLAGINMRRATVALADDDEPCGEDCIQPGEPNV